MASTYTDKFRHKVHRPHHTSESVCAGLLSVMSGAEQLRKRGGKVSQWVEAFPNTVPMRYSKTQPVPRPQEFLYWEGEWKKPG